MSRNQNPFIDDTPQGTVSRCQQSLNIFHLVLTDRNCHDVALDFDGCCALLYLTDGLSYALMDVVDKLDGYTLKGESPTDVNSS